MFAVCKIGKRKDRVPTTMAFPGEIHTEGNETLLAIESSQYRQDNHVPCQTIYQTPGMFQDNQGLKWDALALS